MRLRELIEGQFRSKDIEEFKPSNNDLDELKSKYLPDWEMLDHRDIQAKYVAKDHRHAEKFVIWINRLSEKMDHFAEVTQDVAEVTVKTSTFDVKGLTILDFQLALYVDAYAEKNDIEQVRMSGNFGMHENFADGKKPGRKGLAKRSGVNCKASVTQLRKVAKNSSGERQRMAHQCANMKSGKRK
jgi:pterin-4a-carbinolamine dehydratase